MEKTYINTKIDSKLYTHLKILSAHSKKKINALLEEGIEALLIKYYGKIPELNDIKNDN